MVASAAECCSRLYLGCRTDTSDESQLVEAARVHHVLNQKISRLIHIFIENDGFLIGGRETPTDGSSNLHEKNGATFEAQRREPAIREEQNNARK